MPTQAKSDTSVHELSASRSEQACDLDGRVWGCGGLVCRVKFVTTIALIAFLIVGSALGLF